MPCQTFPRPWATIPFPEASASAFRTHCSQALQAAAAECAHVTDNGRCLGRVRADWSRHDHR